MSWFRRTAGPGQATEHESPAEVGPAGQPDHDAAVPDASEDEAAKAAAVLVLGEAAAESAALLSGALPVRLSVAQTNNLLESVFDLLDHLLGVLGVVGDGLRTTFKETAARGPVWDDADADRARLKLNALDQTLVNLVTCRDTLGGVHLLLHYARLELARIDNNHGTADHSAKEENTDD